MSNKEKKKVKVVFMTNYQFAATGETYKPSDKAEFDEALANTLVRMGYAKHSEVQKDKTYKGEVKESAPTKSTAKVKTKKK